MNRTEKETYYGICFQPYVGPWDGSQPVLYNTYTLAQVTTLLRPIAKVFSRIHTYGQGTFVWQGTPIVQDSNRFNIEAAKSVGLKVSAGCYQQGADPGGDSINIEWTKTEIDYAIAQAKVYGNVDELIVGNECLWGPGSTGDLTTLIEYAKTQRSAAGYDATTMPVTTAQQWGVLAGVNAPGPMQTAMLSMLAACEGSVYANIYAYFDPNIAGVIGPNPSQSVFSKAVVSSTKSSWSALMAAFSAQKVAVAPRIGEIGWPTSGTQPAQPAPIASVTYADWHYIAIQRWLAANPGIKAYLFAGYDEPWKGNEQGTGSEAYFGMWKALGTSTEPSDYTLTGEKRKYS